jgi:hypothetical protein
MSLTFQSPSLFKFEVVYLCSDIVGFTAVCSSLSPMDVVLMLNLLYTKFDDFCGIFDLYKIGKGGAMIRQTLN